MSINVRKIFDIDLRDISLNETLYREDGTTSASISYINEMFLLQLPCLQFIDVDTEIKQLAVSLQSSDALYDDILDDFITELSSILAESTRKLLKDRTYNFRDIYSLYDKTKVLLIDYSNSTLFHKGNRITIDEFERLLDGTHLSIINHYNNISITDDNIVTDVKTYQININ